MAIKKFIILGVLITLSWASFPVSSAEPPPGLNPIERSEWICKHDKPIICLRLASDYPTMREAFVATEYSEDKIQRIIGYNKWPPEVLDMPYPAMSRFLTVRRGTLISGRK